MRDEGGECEGGSDLHFFVDAGGAAIEGAAEDAGEGEDVIDLVGEVGASRTNDASAGAFCEVGHDFGGGVSHGEDDGIDRHGADHIFGYDVGGGDTDKDVGTHERIGEVALHL